jgi:cytochrome bd-type quinol oxidase subunit 2
MTAGALFDSILKVLRYLGMLGFLGGLAALSAIWAFGPTPKDIDQWRVLIGAARAVFYACMFSGIIILVIAGSLSWWRRRRELHPARWFRFMIALLIIAIPTLHLSARSVALKLYAAMDAPDLARTARLWDKLGLLYFIALLALTLIAALGILKPRLGSKNQSAGDNRSFQD